MSLFSNIRQYINHLFKRETKTRDVVNEIQPPKKRWVSITDERKVRRLKNKIDQLEARERQLIENISQLQQIQISSQSDDFSKNINEIIKSDSSFILPPLFKIPAPKELISVYSQFHKREARRKELEDQIKGELIRLFVALENSIDTYNIQQAEKLIGNISQYNSIPLFSQYKERFQDNIARIEQVKAEIAERKKKHDLEELENRKRKRQQELNNLLAGQLDKLQAHINRNDLATAVKEIAAINCYIVEVESDSLKNRFDKLKTRYEETSRKELIKKQAALLTIQHAKAEKERQLREEQEHQERQKKERIVQEKIRKEKAKQAEQANLDSLLVRKENWQEFEKVLLENKITKLYHFTDIGNIKSIRENGGLYSWHYCDQKGIEISRTGGSITSRRLDKRKNLEDYVRLSFCSNHPMRYRLELDGYNLVLLEVDLCVAFFEHTRFSDINATSNDVSEGPYLLNLMNVNFEATKRTYLSRDDADFHYHQAEVMVKTWIPIKYITNIDRI